MDSINWFPLDRIDELETEISNLVIHRKTRRDGVCIALGLCGLRVGEVTGSLAKYFQPHLRKLYVKTTKKGIPRTIDLHQTLVDAIQICREESGHANSKWLLPSRRNTRLINSKISAKATKLFQKLGVTFRPRFHMLRHTFAMRLLAETNDIMLVKKNLGHRSVHTTQVYAESLKGVPASCMVKVFDVRSPFSDANPQLMLFNPAEFGVEDGDDSEKRTA